MSDVNGNTPRTVYALEYWKRTDDMLGAFVLVGIYTTAEAAHQAHRIYQEKTLVTSWRGDVPEAAKVAFEYHLMDNVRLRPMCVDTVVDAREAYGP